MCCSECTGDSESPQYKPLGGSRPAASKAEAVTPSVTDQNILCAIGGFFTPFDAIISMTNEPPNLFAADAPFGFN
eukprot:4605838-Amphidinium_carterae.1